MPNKCRVLITDLDDTLWDWVRIVVESYEAMVDAVIADFSKAPTLTERLMRTLSPGQPQVQWDKEQLKREIKAVHERHQDAEFPFSILHTPTVLAQYSNEVNLALHQAIYQKKKQNGQASYTGAAWLYWANSGIPSRLTGIPAPSTDDLALLDAREKRNVELECLKKCFKPFLTFFEEKRREALEPSLYGDVRGTLQKMREAGIVVVSYTDANLYAVLRRMQDLNLIDFFDHIVCREIHDELDGPARRYYHQMRENIGEDKLAEKVVQIPKSMSKPQPQVLSTILEKLRNDFPLLGDLAPGEVAYMGDSLRRDIRMANEFNASAGLSGDAALKAIHAIYAQTKHGMPSDKRKRLFEFLRVTISYWTPEMEQAEVLARQQEQTFDVDYSAGGRQEDDLKFDDILNMPFIKATIDARHTSGTTPLVSQYGAAANDSHRASAAPPPTTDTTARQALKV